jgi:hypothetical protein
MGWIQSIIYKTEENHKMSELIPNIYMSFKYK